MRSQRKLEHIKHALNLHSTPNRAGFSDIRLVHCSAPELKPADIDASCIFLGKKLAAPLMINALTGGHSETTYINRSLALMAARLGIAMAVGSQRAAIDDPALSDSFSVARKFNPEGLLLANMSATCHYREALAAVEMIGADGLQLHLNLPQELTMAEGDTDFSGVLENIEMIVEQLPVPVVVKEVGFGLSRETVLQLKQRGIKYFDTGGRGGTNFIAIEKARGGIGWPELEDWGLTTVTSLLECTGLGLNIFFVASGGIRNGLDVAKSLAGGAGLAAMAAPFLEALLKGSQDSLYSFAGDIIKDLKRIMLLTGASNIEELGAKPLVVMGESAQWLQRRGVDIDSLARRGSMGN